MNVSFEIVIAAALLAFNAALIAAQHDISSFAPNKEMAPSRPDEDYKDILMRLEQKYSVQGDQLNRLQQKYLQQEEYQADLEERVTNLEERVAYLEAITRKIVPRTCEDLYKLGVSQSGQYLIDPDGSGAGDAPMTVYCDFETPNKGRTVVQHDAQGLIDVDRCPDAGCHRTSVTYDGTERQLRTLMELSENCEQSITYECFSAPLEINGVNMAWWVGSDGQPNHYWHGAAVNPDVHMCSCYQTGTCTIPEVTCNCDAGAPQWMVDEGTLTDLDVLPVEELRFGGLKYDGQAAKFKLGPLVCSGRKEFSATASCEMLALAGHTNPGYYWVDGIDGINFDLVKCNLDLDPQTDQDYQQATPAKIPEYPVAFDVRFVNYGVYNLTSTIIPFDEVLLNAGGAMSPSSGVFTAPLHGVYQFSFFYGKEIYVDVGTHVELRTGNRTLATSFARAEADYGGDRSSEGEVVIVELNPGDTFYAWLVDGQIYGVAEWDTRMTGHLLYVL